MIAIVDYDAGNLMSVKKALEYIGETPVVTRDVKTILAADKVILPGVGAFGDCMEKLNAKLQMKRLRFWEFVLDFSFYLTEATNQKA